MMIKVPEGTVIIREGESNMYIKDLEDSKNNAYLKGFSGYFSKQFAKYNATNMKDPMKEFKGKINYKV